MNFTDHARNEAQILVEKLSSASRKEAEALATQARVDAEVRAEETLHAKLAEANTQAEKKLEAKLAEALAEAKTQAEKKLTAKLAEAVAEASTQAEKKLGARLAEAAEKHAAALASAAARASEEQAAALSEAAAGAEKNIAKAIADADARVHAAAKEAADHVSGAQSEIAGLLSECEEQRTTLAETRLHVESAQASSLTLLDGMRSGLHAIQHATTPNGILDTLLEHIGEHFEQTAVFHVGPSVQGWRARHSGVTFDLRGVTIPDAVTALVANIASGREARSVEASAAEPLVGLSHAPVADAFAVPLFVNGCVLAVIYAENAKLEGAVAKQVGPKMAGILVEQATRRLSKRPVARPPEYSAPRQARRVKLQSSVDITLDGSASFLVDLSSLGAQVLSPLALRPNRVVEMELIGGSQVVQCKGRVIWALFEQPKGTSSTLYRAGVQFTEVDMSAVESFLATQGLPGVLFCTPAAPLQQVR